MCLTTVDVCVHLCLCIRHIGGMDVSILACMILCVFLFSKHIHETKLELFSVWLVCHVFNDFDSRKNFKTEQEREREREREKERERGREKERERGRERGGGRERERGEGGREEREREREQDEEGGRKRGREEGGKWCKRIQELTYWLQWCSHQMKASTFVVKICSHSLALACLTTFILPN